MTCHHVKVGGFPAIICTGSRTKIRTCHCGELATALCDWKMPGGGTCDAPLCEAHAHQPAEGKDLCPRHAKAWAQHPANRQRDLAL